MTPLVVTLGAASDLVPWSVAHLRRAVLSDGSKGSPPPLRAKRDVKGRILIRVDDLLAWHDSLPDA